MTPTEIENESNKNGGEVAASLESVCTSTGRGCECTTSKYTLLSYSHLNLQNALIASYMYFISIL